MSDDDIRIDQATYERIVALYEEGEKLIHSGQIPEAFQKYVEAWYLIPDPRQLWEISTPLISAIADCCFMAGEYAEVLEALEFGMHCPGATENPFLHLRLGQALLEVGGDDDRAADALMRAYDAHGERIFEHQDPKYLAFLAARGRIER
jgi:tetratricopeptide (TPR) repeat protein